MNSRAQANTVFHREFTGFAYGKSLSTPIFSRTGTVRVAHLRSDWMRDLRDRFDELTSLPKGWDGYNGRPVSFTCAHFAANLLERLANPEVPAPYLVPGSDGTVQLEWHRNNFDVEIEVLAPYQVIATRYSYDSDAAEELHLDSDFTKLQVWIEELKDRPAMIDFGGVA